tara:strand:+ start:72 stop:623 length:552 start_codon:yes stop_codon:yes gene_type:complete
MGLDMYLEGSFSKRAYVQPTDQQYADMREGKEVTVERSQALIDALEATGLQNAPIEHEWNHLTYVFPIWTWRKANQIHKWFVDNCQEGDDNCQRHYVSRENLEELLEIINTILEIKDSTEKITKAKELLPTDIEGCFFGSEEYDDWYFENLEDTKKVLDKLFAYEETAEDGHHFDNFYYQSSW